MAYTTIDLPTDYFNTKLYTGTGSSNAITGVGFQPDLTWIKSRSVAGSGHRWHDSVRGAGNMIASDSTGAEFDDSALFTSFDSDGFTVAGTGSSYNGSSSTYASWNWLASNTTASNTDGSITSTVSANTTAGFSVGTYSGNSTTGATVGHGLGSAPSMVIVKKTNATGDWYIYHAGIGATAFIKLNDTAASATNTLWNNTAPTSSVFSMDSNSAVNGSGDSYVFYAFAEKKGYSKFGSYTGNGSTDGTFIYTGFKPALVIIKRTDSSSGAQWLLLDSVRSDINIVNENLFANLSNAESSIDRCDFTAQGFKLRQTGTTVNTSGGSYIYMAFAESPFVTGASGIPTTAR